MQKHFSLLAALWALAFCGIVQAAPTCTPISIAPNTALASGTAGTSYGPVTFTASGSSATPYAYDISSGLPANGALTINPATGVLSGTPTQAGSFLMTVTATDTNGCSGGRTYALDVAVGDQTITFTSVPPGSAVVGGATYNVTATATSGLPVTFTIDASATAVCSIAGSTVSFIGVGNCVIDANQSGNASFNAAPQAQQNFAVGKGSQTITFTSVPPSNPPIGGPTYNVTATATSGLPVTFTIDATASSVCSIAGNTVSFTGSGNCVIDANQAGDANWNAAPQAQQTFGVAKKAQTISFTSTAPVGAKVGGATYNVTATATSGLAVTFTIDATASSVCSIAGSTVSFIAAGTCVIDANQAGDATYGAAPQQQQSFAVGKGDQTITYTSVPPGSASAGGATYNVTATASSGLAVTFTIDAAASSICSITGNTVSFIGAGTCVIDANQAGDANWNAAPQQQQSFLIGKGNQTITFTSVPPGSPIVGGPTYNVTATSNSGLAVTFTIDATASTVCSIAGSTVSFIGQGTCVIDANQAGDANWNAAPQAQQSFGVNKTNQTITFTSSAPVGAVVAGPTYTVTATASSGLTVTFTIDASASTICSIAGSVVSFIGAGTCVIDANQAGDATYNAAPQLQQSFAVGKGNQTISYTSTAPLGATVGGPTYNVSATATSGLAVTFTIDASAASVCSIAGSTVSFIAVGTCVIDANQAGDANWNAAPQLQQSFAVGKGNQTISFTSSPPASPVVGGPTYNVTATATSGLPVTLTIDASATTICSIAGSTVSFIGAGTCVIDADQAGDVNYNAAPQAQQSFLVGKGTQTIVFTSLPPSAAKVGGPTYDVTATGGASGNPVVFTIDATATGICSITGNTVSFTAVGTCVIDADQAGNANYNAALTAQQSFGVAIGDQTITYTSTAPAATVGGATYDVTATATSGLPVTFSIDATATSVCSINTVTNTVSFTAVGTCVIDADQAGDANWNPAPQAQQSFLVGKGSQTISFTSTAPVGAKVGGPTYTVTATATSGLPVTFTIDATATSVCSIAGSTVSFLTVGTCVIDANQAGNANYTAAPQQQQSFAVAKGDQTITFTSTPPVGVKVGDPAYTVTATSSAGLAVTFSLDASSTGCSLAGSSVTFPAGGTCVIDANQAGNGNYNAAPQAQQTFVVAKLDQTITFTSSAPGGAKVGGATYTVTATASSGLAVIFSAGSTACTVVGSTVTFVHATTCTVNADQAGNAQYNPAPQAQQSFAVAKGDQTISFSTTAPTFGSATAAATPHTYNPAATATSTLAVTFSTSGACSFASPTVTFGPGAGTCTINADQLGDADWNPAPQVQQSTTVEIPASAVGDSHGVTGNVAIAAATSVMSNDSGTAIAIKSYGATTGAEQTSIGTATPTAQGGSVTLIAVGTYSYDPPANFTGTTANGNADSFKYIIGNDLTATSTATVTLDVSDRIIVVASGASGNCKPVTPTPCALSTADAAAAATGIDLVFVQSGAYTSPNATITLNANQKLVGNFVSLAQAISDAGITLASESVALATISPSTTPTLSNNNNVITLGGGNLIEYFSITNSAGSAILGNAAGSGTSSIHDITVTDGAVAGNGVNITANLGTLNFSNLVVATSSGNAFAATGGGTVNVTTGSTPNTLTSTTGTALNVANTTIGASGLNFRSITAGTAASGPANGIVLNNTGVSGGLTITGNSAGVCGGNVGGGPLPGTPLTTTAANSADCTGGTIQKATNAAISLTSTVNVSLTRVHLTNNTHYGILGSGVSGFTLTDSLIDGTNGSITGSAFDGSINFQNLTGSASITRAVITGGFYNNITVKNDSATPLNRITLDKTQTGSTNVNNNDNINFESLSGSSAVIKATIQNSVLTAAAGDLLQYANNGNANGGDIVLTNSQLSNNHPLIATGGGGVSISGGAGGDDTFQIDHSTFRDSVGSAVLIVKPSSTAHTYVGTFDSNRIGVTGVANSGSLEGSGLKIQTIGGGVGGTGGLTATVTNNVIQQYNNDGMTLQAGGGAPGDGTGFFNATATSNTVGPLGTNISAAQGVGVRVTSGTASGDSFQSCAKIALNTLTNSGITGTPSDYRVRQRFSTTVRLPGYSNTPGNTAAVVSFLDSNNTTTAVPGGTATADYPATGGGFTGTGTTCP